MEIGIIGFQKSGKTTVFNALTGQQAVVSAFSTGRAEPNLAVVPVPDERLDQLAAIYKPKKTTPATVHYVDLAGMERKPGEPGSGLGEAQLHAIAQCDALMAVIRGFTNAAGEAPEIAAEAEAIVLEMILSDLGKVENRIERLARSKGKIGGDEGKRNAIELAALERLKARLENNEPVRDEALAEEELKLLRGFQFLTGKPLMLLVNAPEEALGGTDDPAAELRSLEGPGVSVTWMSASTEMDISRLAPEEREVFLQEYGIKEPAARRIIALSYDLLGLMSFLTAGPDECRAWTVKKGVTAPEAAGAIHSDLQRGFIRAEVCRWEDLVKHGSIAELKKHGLLRLEGKSYIVQDGDVMNILFSV